jgi:NADPH2:quinone reductase
MASRDGARTASGVVSMAEWRGLRLESLVTPDATVVLSLADDVVGDPGPDEVIVRIEAAPINPSDLGVMFASGDVGRADFGGSTDRSVVKVPLSDGAMNAVRARVGQSLPVGNEGAGTVVAAGSGEAARALEDRLVAVSGGGMYSQLRRVRVADCLPLPDGATAAEGAASFVNPMTVLGMVETMRDEGHRALVHTAAASSLGRMLVRLCKEEAIPLVNVVRSPEQVELLRKAGAEYVCDSSGHAFDEELTAALKETGATIAFDAVGGGSLADRILDCMERAISEGAEFRRYGSTVHKQVYTYGGLDMSPTMLRRTYGMSWGVGGWLMPNFLQQARPERVEEMRRRVAEGLTTTFATEFTDTATLTEALKPHMFAAYSRPKTGTKFLITPNG